MHHPLRLALALSLPPALGCALPDPTAPDRLGPELQLYPAGIVAGARLERPVGERSVHAARLAANLTDRRDFGEHDDERGLGFGGGLGVRTWTGARGRGWHYGGRVDLWWLDIDWEDDAPPRKGRSEVLVLQPAVEGGYSWPAGDGRLDLTLSVGAEVNVDTSGEDVGEGAILLVGLAWLP